MDSNEHGTPCLVPGCCCVLCDPPHNHFFHPEELTCSIVYQVAVDVYTRMSVASLVESNLLPPQETERANVTISNYPDQIGIRSDFYITNVRHKRPVIESHDPCSNHAQA